MVAFSTTMDWLTDNVKRSLSSSNPGCSSNNLGILAFETAKTMSRILSLYKSLSDDNVSKLRNRTVKSEGVLYLNSKEESLLLRLACAEMLEDLDNSAAAVARLGRKCSDFGLNRFELVYTDLKLGTIDLGKMEYGSREIEKRARKMERLIATTASLHSSLESLSELEMSERRLNQWKKNNQMKEANFEVFEQRLINQKKQVRHYREVSLWGRTFDNSVSLMARLVCVVYARICFVFGPYIPVHPIKEQMITRSGPIKSTAKPCLVRFYSQKSILSSSENRGPVSNNNRVFHAAGPNTVGGSGLTTRYANVILLVEKYLDSWTEIGKDDRKDLYEMLPEKLRATMRSKLGRNLSSAKGAAGDEALAEWWREAMAGILRWLAPVAEDTLKWQMERNLEKTNFDPKPTVLLLQTLHFADNEKTEAAVAELLVGLSCVCRYENRGPPVL